MYVIDLSGLLFHQERKAETLSQSDVLQFPVFASAMLVGIYVLIKVLPCLSMCSCVCSCVCSCACVCVCVFVCSCVCVCVLVSGK